MDQPIDDLAYAKTILETALLTSPEPLPLPEPSPSSPDIIPFDVHAANADARASALRQRM